MNYKVPDESPRNVLLFALFMDESYRLTLLDSHPAVPDSVLSGLRLLHAAPPARGYCVDRECGM